MQANLDVIGPEMAMGDPVSAFWFASRCRTSGSRPAESLSAPMTPGGPPGPARVAAKTIRQILPTPVRFGQSWLSVARPGSGGDGPKRLRILDPCHGSAGWGAATDSDRPARQQTERR